MGILQVLHNKFGHSCIEMNGGASTVYPMVLIGIELHLKLFIGLYQCLCKIHGVLEMDIIITPTMYQQELSLQSIGKVDGRIVIIS